MEHLEKWNLMENTVVIFMSDNGMTGNGGGKGGKPLGTLPDGTPLPWFNAGMKGLKGSADEGGVRVRWIARWDGRVAQVGSHDELVAQDGIYRRLVEHQLTASS